MRSDEIRRLLYQCGIAAGRARWSAQEMPVPQLFFRAKSFAKGDRAIAARDSPFGPERVQWRRRPSWVPRSASVEHVELVCSSECIRKTVHGNRRAPHVREKLGITQTPRFT